jgi:hypothetical protein
MTIRKLKKKRDVYKEIMVSVRDLIPDVDACIKQLSKRLERKDLGQ